MSEENEFKVFKFDGEDKNWREWAAKTKAIGSTKGWWEYISNQNDTSTKTKAEQDKDKEWNIIAYRHLLLSCTGPAFAYVETTDGNAREAWTNLAQRYEASESTDLIDLIDNFNSCKMSKNGNPDEWIHELLYLRKRFENAGGSKKDDIELILHVIMHAPKEYKVPIEVLSASRSTLTLEQVKKNLTNYWKRNLKDEVKKNDKNMALTAEGKTKKPWKKFKGVCKKCGTAGRKSLVNLTKKRKRKKT